MNPRVEFLESRRLLAAIITELPTAGLIPTEIQNAYGFENVDFIARNKQVVGNGAGQTIAIVDPYNDPTIGRDLRVFDKAFDLPNNAARGGFALSVSRPEGRTATDPSWAQEIALDVEWAHALAPKARILLVEARSQSPQDLLKAVDYARHRRGVTVVSMSWGYDAPPANAADFNAVFTTPPNHFGGVSKGDGVTFVMAAGDDGVLGAWPDATVPVVSVGGTLLSLDPFGNYLGESLLAGDSQSATAGAAGAGNRGFDVYDTTEFQGIRGWQTVQGTSAAAPQWAALFAIGDQGRALEKKHSLDGPTQTLPALAALPSSDFHVVAGGGASTGLGSPFADQIIPALVAI